LSSIWMPRWPALTATFSSAKADSQI